MLLLCAMVWIDFGVAALIIVASGTLLAVYADRLADKTGISGALIGLILLSIITSLPELGTSVAAVAYLGKPDLAAGNIFGSNAFNMLVLGILDLFLGAVPIYALSRVSHYRSSMLAMLMTVVAMAAIYAGGFGNIAGRVGLDSILLVAVYCAGIYFIFKEERASQASQASPHPDADAETKKESIALEAGVVAVCGVVVVATGFYLSNISDEIVEITGWGESFVGHLFLAVSTSLPELVVAITAIRLKAYDMAIANVLGSCFFNIIIFSVVDPFYEKPILADISRINLTLAFVSLAMIGVAMAALYAARKGKSSGLVKWVLFGLYLLGTYLVFSPN